MSNNKPSLGHILGRLAGIIFLATPHRGSALADVAEKLLLVNAIIRLPQNFIRSLRQNSPELSVQLCIFSSSLIGLLTDLVD